MEVGLVLSGGAAKAIAQIGVLQALLELGFKPVMASGVSGGALTGTFHAAGYTPEEMLHMIIEAGSKSYLRPTIRKGGIFKMDTMEAFFRKHLGDKKFQDLNIPMYVATTDLHSGETIIFSQGDMVKPLAASTSIPVLYRPVKVGNYSLSDGSINNNLPVEPLLGKVPFIIGILTNGARRNFKKISTRSVFLRSLELSIYHNALARAEKCDFLIEPEQLAQFKLLDIAKGKEIFQHGYDTTMKVADDLLQAYRQKMQLASS